MLIRLRVALSVCVIGAMSVACSRLGVRHPFGPKEPPQAAVHPVGTWVVAASGEFQTHHWVRYAAPANRGGICFALTVDGRNAQIRALPAHAPGASGPAGEPTAFAGRAYHGHVPLCGLLEALNVSPIEVVNVP